MGTPIPIPFPPPPPADPADPCTTCWGVGKPFGSGDTPDEFEVKFSGQIPGPAEFLNNGPNAPNGTWTVIQSIASACTYRSSIPGVTISVNFGVNATTVTAVGPAGSIFLGSQPPTCSTLILGFAFFGSTGSAKLLIPGVT